VARRELSGFRPEISRAGVVNRLARHISKYEERKRDAFEILQGAKGAMEAEIGFIETAAEALWKDEHCKGGQCRMRWAELPSEFKEPYRRRARVVVQSLAPIVTVVRDKERGAYYYVLGLDYVLQSSRLLKQGDLLAVYRGPGGKGWAMPMDEFRSGKFEELFARKAA
jgi:hypothetical protein